MSRRKSIITNAKQPQPPPTPLRRSPRFLREPNTPKPQDPSTHNRKSANNRVHSPDPHFSSRKDASCKKNHEDCPQRVSKKSIKSNHSSSSCRKFPRLNSEIDGVRCLRRSPRFSKQTNNQGVPEKTRDDESKKLTRSKKDSRAGTTVSLERKMVVALMNKSMRKEDLTDGRRDQVGVVCSNEEIVEERDGAVARSEEMGFKKKGKRGENCNGSIQGWTREQEVALQRAYFVAKPTPHFWKKVSKLVPGKSAQECFDKVHADHITPPQPQPRSRVNKLNSSLVEHFSFSAGKLLQPIEPKFKKSNYNKPKSHLAQKTVRKLLQKRQLLNQDYEADLFSILESNINPSTQDYQSNDVLSTPKHVQEKQGFLRKCRERSSAGGKKPLSRFNGSSGMALVSPPVLKQVKNRALHEKYIDQLHSREAKRKAEFARAKKAFTGKENSMDNHVKKMDVVRAAKNSLLSDVRNAINQLQHLKADSMSNSSDIEDDAVHSEDDEGDF
ncbi:hypothetical protein CFOL_v3_08161 [Cephalotus follicularis]|uniref:Myb-like domain-containing protein n=1 Tax=Cephalotus follicularis TaxID=3775 RepID=A0A1Q3BA27_CEPFO|nr:hypothetical protein CFOL_v3_08161 [Cephalotus follicularis]